MKLLAGFLIAFGIGAFCRLAKIPSPAPQAIVGALLVVAMSTGYVTADRLMTRHNGAIPLQPSSVSTKGNPHARHSISSVR
jgi:XapX domain-containing protein